MKRLLASGLLPRRAGQPVKAWSTCPSPTCASWTWTPSSTARTVACNAMLVPVVTCDLDPGAVKQLIGLCVQCDHRRRQASDHTGADNGTVPLDGRASRPLCCDNSAPVQAGSQRQPSLSSQIIALPSPATPDIP